MVMLGVVLTAFFLFNALPADPARLTLGQRSDMASLQNVRKELFLDRPLIVQLGMYINDISPLSLRSDSRQDLRGHPCFTLLRFSASSRLVLQPPYLRRSYQTRKEVWDILMEALPGTAILALAAMLFATLVGISLGVLSASKPHTWVDTSAMMGSVVGLSAPSFFSAIILAYIFGFLLSHYTGLQMTGSLYDTDPFLGKTLVLKNLILPAITLGLRPLAIIVQLTRSAMLDELSKDYIRTARAKGLSRPRILYKHALKNALNPVLTAVTGWLAELLAGSFFVEYIFGWKGIGKVTVDALEKLDFPVVMGSVLVIAFFFLVINLFTDILYRVIDPRVKPI